MEKLKNLREGFRDIRWILEHTRCELQKDMQEGMLEEFSDHAKNVLPAYNLAIRFLEMIGC